MSRLWKLVVSRTKLLAAIYKFNEPITAPVTRPANDLRIVLERVRAIDTQKYADPTPGSACV